MTALHLNNDTFQQLLMGDKPALVEFWAPWCDHCRNLESDFDQIVEDYSHWMTIGKINIDDHPQLAEKYFIEYVPTLVLFSEGDLIDFVIAPSDYDGITQFIKEAL